MALPADITTVTVSATYATADGSPCTGSVWFTPSIPVAAEGAILPLAPLKVNLDQTGGFSVDLAATDDPDWGEYAGFVYVVTELIDGARRPRSYNIEVPAATPGGELDLAAVVPVAEVGQMSPYLLVGGGTLTGGLAINAVTGGLDPEDLPVGPTAAARANGLQIVSSFQGGEDNVSGTDSTGRINLYSYQRAATHSFGEVIRLWAMKQDSKQMIAWYGAQKTGTQEDGYDDTTRNVLASGVSWKPWAWIGAHYEANDHNSVHGHISIEVPDSTGALQTRLEILFADRTTGLIGLDKSFIVTNQSDFVVRCSSGQMLRLAAAAGTEKTIQFSNDSFGATASRRWAIKSNADSEAGSSAGSDFEIVRYNDSGTAVDAPIKIIRAGNGNVQIGAASASTLIAQGRITVGTTTANVRKLYVEEPTATNAAVQIKATALGTASVAIMQLESSDATKRFSDFRVTGDDVPRVKLENVSGGGGIHFGDGTVNDTNAYRSAANVLKTDDSFHVALDLRHLGTNLGFYNATAVAKQTVTGSRGSNAALASLLTALSTLGLITDSSS